MTLETLRQWLVERIADEAVTLNEIQTQATDHRSPYSFGPALNLKQGEYTFASARKRVFEEVLAQIDRTGI